VTGSPKIRTNSVRIRSPDTETRGGESVTRFPWVDGGIREKTPGDLGLEKSGEEDELGFEGVREFPRTVKSPERLREVTG
jgi:hypothetical protein